MSQSVQVPRAGTVERVNAFRVGGTYLFRHRFEADELLDALREHYDCHRRRFQVAESSLADLKPLLARHGYELRVVDDIRAFVVLADDAVPDDVARTAVARLEVDGRHALLLADVRAVERAVDAGARRLSEAGGRLPLGALAQA